MMNMLTIGPETFKYLDLPSFPGLALSEAVIVLLLVK